MGATPPDAAIQTQTAPRGSGTPSRRQQRRFDAFRWLEGRDLPRRLRPIRKSSCRAWNARSVGRVNVVMRLHLGNTSLQPQDMPKKLMSIVSTGNATGVYKQLRHRP
eukprot:349801-Chlamydomonas_euryale.AAC.25